MGHFDWFGVTFCLLGLLSMLSGCYEWTWFWRLARGGYLPDQIGYKNARLLYIITGIGCLGIGFAQIVQTILSINSVCSLLSGFVFATALTEKLYYARNHQTILELFPSIGKNKSKPTNKDENPADS